MRSTCDSSSSLTISCDFNRGFHSACALRGHFLRRAFPRLRLSVLDGTTAVSKLMLLSYARPSTGSVPPSSSRAACLLRIDPIGEVFLPRRKDSCQRKPCWPEVRGWDVGRKMESRV